MGNALSQSFRIAEPSLTEKNLSDQKGRVHIVTGGYAGVGYELSKILYGRNATVFVAGRSKDKGENAIKRLREEVPTSEGKLEFLQLDLANLSTIKASAENLMSRTSALHVLTNNAGVMFPPQGSKTAQGHDLQVGTNCLGPYLFTKLVLPLMRKTQQNSPPNTVRVTWAASVATELIAPKNGVPFKADGTPDIPTDPQKCYGLTKAANFYLATEVAKRHGQGKDGIVSVAWNPGNLRSELQRHMSGIQAKLTGMILYQPVYGAYTELFAACSEELTVDKGGAYVVPWGKVGSTRADLVQGSKSKAEGGTGVAEQFWEWCENETKQYS